MFTGIVKEIGTVESIERSEAGARIRIAATFSGELGDGDSVSVSGACMTAAARGDGWFEADVMNQSLDLTNLGDLAESDTVNLEPALRAGDPLGGHMVQGHVDCVGEVVEVREDGIARRVAVAVPEERHRYLVEQGSVTVDGVSLTVANLRPGGFEISLIPETQDRTTLGAAVPGSRVNIEFDVIARYVERLLQSSTGKG